MHNRSLDLLRKPSTEPAGGVSELKSYALHPTRLLELEYLS